MNYDVRLRIAYRYEAAVSGGRHLVRVMPPTRSGVQTVVAASLSFDPAPTERVDHADFFGNMAAAIAYARPHDLLRIDLIARIRVERDAVMLDVSPGLDGLQRELAGIASLAPESPQHFRHATPRVPIDADITAYARQAIDGASSAMGIADALCRRIHQDFAYDAEATLVDTPVREAFDLRRGVCQDFSHVMIAALRGLGIPAAYVSGFLRTDPPAGQERLIGADAMHAWVRVWCGNEAGWLEFDPTNAVPAGDGHIVIGHGRDYSDVSPIVGVVKTSGAHETEQAVDVVPLD
ncbi:MAG: transglutaminase family protein [Alphaproteobacteria bacterium]